MPIDSFLSALVFLRYRAVPGNRGLRAYCGARALQYSTVPSPAVLLYANTIPCGMRLYRITIIGAILLAVSRTGAQGFQGGFQGTLIPAHYIIKNIKTGGGGGGGGGAGRCD